MERSADATSSAVAVKLWRPVRPGGIGLADDAAFSMCVFMAA